MSNDFRKCYAKKLQKYDFNEITSQSFKSFLPGRKQRVKIGREMSEPIELRSGVPPRQNPVPHNFHYLWDRPRTVDSKYTHQSGIERTTQVSTVEAQK